MLAWSVSSNLGGNEVKEIMVASELRYNRGYVNSQVRVICAGRAK